MKKYKNKQMNSIQKPESSKHMRKREKENGQEVISNIYKKTKQETIQQENRFSGRGVETQDENLNKRGKSKCITEIAINRLDPVKTKQSKAEIKANKEL